VDRGKFLNGSNTDVYSSHFSVVAADQTDLRIFIVYIVAD